MQSSHTHLDHWDDAAQEGLPKDIPLFTQHAQDVKIIESQGFTNVRVTNDYAEFGGVKISKIGGQHGSDEMFANPDVADFLGEAMGFVLAAPGVKTLYLAGDTVWRNEVDQAIEDFQPQVIVLNSGMALLSEPAGAMIMGKDDVLRACQVAPTAKVVAIHLDAINHISLTREALRAFMKQEGIQDR